LFVSWSDTSDEEAGVDDATTDLAAHLTGISIRMGHQLHAPGGRSNTGTAHLSAELWALREVRWRGAAATLLHDARGLLPVLPPAIVAQARAELWPAVA
jgi:hypothetical protein